MRNLIYSGLKTPDGTVISSKHRHDYQQYTDKNGETYIIDGGLDYIRTSVNIEKAEYIQLYDDDDIEIIRQYFQRYTEGNYRYLYELTDDHIKNIITYIDNDDLSIIYKKELEYRGIEY